MTECTIYQTLEDTNNYDEIENHGPYKCRKENAWLGHGYYFWEEEIKWAHKWGADAGYGSNYIIVKSSYDYDKKNFLDLVGHPKDLKLLRDILALYKERKPNENITIPSLIEFAKDVLKNDFKYIAIRVNSEYQTYGYTLSFPGKRQAMKNLNPQIQICVIKKSFLLSPFKIIYPDFAVQ